MTRRAASLLCAVVALSGCDDGSTPPLARAPQSAPPGAVPPVSAVLELPEAHAATFGLYDVLLLPDREVPLVSFEARLVGGARRDREGEEGTAALLAEMLRRGAGKRDAATFQADVDFVGGTFSTGAAGRWIEVEAEFLKEDVDLAIELVHDVLTAPRFDPEEFEKVRALEIDRIRAARQSPGAVMGLYWNSWLLRTRGVTWSGDEASLAQVRLDDVKWAWGQCSSPGRVWLTVAGDFEVPEMRKRLALKFGPVDAANVPGMEPPPKWEFAEPQPGARVLLVDKPGALQTYFRFGGGGFDRSDPDYPARHLANTILGGRFTSRLNTALRIESGLSYGARSWFDDELGGAFVVYSYTATPTSREALELGLSTYRTFQGKGITREEFESARNYIKGQYAPGRLETGAEAASMILSLAFDGLSRDIVDGFFPRLDALTLDDVNRVITERFPSQDLTWVVIGQAEVLRDIVEDFGEVTEVSISGPGFAPR